MEERAINYRRLKSARLYRGKSLDQLAEESGVNRKDIMCFEENKYRPVEDNVWKLCKALKFPNKYFYEKDLIKVIIEGTSLNSKASTNKNEEIACKEGLVMIGKIYGLLDEYVPTKNVNLPKRGQYRDLEAIVNAVRKTWNIGDGPIKNMVSAMVDNGIIVSDIYFDKKGISTFTQKVTMNGDLKYIVSLGNDNRSIARRNYDLAYELGYMIANEVGIPVKKFPMDEFACEFLLPKEEFFKDLVNPTNLNGYLDIKKKYLAPVSAMIFRAYGLGIIDYKKYKFLLLEMEKKGWLKKEPLDDSLKDNNVVGFRSVMDRNNLTLEEIVEILSKNKMTLNPDDVEILLGLKKRNTYFKRKK